VGHDTRRVLREWLGMEEAEIARLTAAGVVTCDAQGAAGANERAGAAD
jgi:hypothetical protein